MLREQKHCDPVVTSQFLSDQLSADEQHAFEEHLESCKRCRDKLAAMAAEQELWSEVRETLGSEVSLRVSPEASLSSSIEPTDDEDKVSACGAVLALLKPTDHPNMLGRFGGYEIVAVIGRGGMGVVLKGFDPSLNRFVAIKVLAPHLATSGAARKRFSREAQAAAAVVHDNVIAIHAVSEDNDHPYLVMPYERGPSLQKRLDESGPLRVAEVLRIGMQAAAGLAAAHAQGIVHRDIKPANILLDEGVERIKLTDFGLARAADDASLTKTGVIAGTPQFMSPEQARGETIAVTSDLFSLGSVLYTMCTGRPPFRAETSYGILRRITDTEPRPIREINPDVPEWLCAIIARLMAKRSGDRFESAGEVAELLEDCLAHVQQPATVPLPASLVAQTSSTRLSSISPRSFGVITMFATLGLVLLGMFLWNGSDAPDNVGNKPATVGANFATGRGTIHFEQGKPTADSSNPSDEPEHAKDGNDVQTDEATSKPRTYSNNFTGKQWKDVFDWLAVLTDCTVNYRVSTEFGFTYQSPHELTLAQVLRFIQVLALKDELLLVFDDKGDSFRVEVAYERFRRAEPERQVGRRIGDFFKVAEYRLEPSNHYPDGLAPPALVYRLETLRDFTAGELRSALETSFCKGEFTRLSDGRLVDAEGWHVGPTDTARSLPSLRKGNTIRLWVSWGVFDNGDFISAIKPGPRSFVRSEDASEIAGQDRTSSQSKSEANSLTTPTKKEQLPDSEVMITQATQLRKTIGELVEKVSSDEAIVKHNPQHDDIGGITKRLENARRELKVHRDELATRIQLLEIQAAHARSAVEAERAQTLLELFRKVDPESHAPAE